MKINHPMTYEQTLYFLYNQFPAYHRIGKAAYKANLENTIKLDNHTGNPHKKFKSIHVAGTNGKGSVSHMIASIFQEAGYKTGLYTSPHLEDFRERIRINGSMIPEEDVVDFVASNIEIIKFLKPSFFEITVSMAFTFFAKSKVDIAVIEVGLGGRLDSTNIINPLLSVITNIGYDHTDLLGDTLEKIANEKAGIIKKNVPVVISETQDETRNVFLSKAHQQQSEIIFADQNFTCTMKEDPEWKGERKFLARDINKEILHEGVTVLTGDYQAKNIMAVLQVFSILKGKMKFSRENILNGIKKVMMNTGLSGRWQILDTSPLIICDTGHNREALEYVIKQLSRIPKTDLHMVIGFVNDKDLTSVLPLFPADSIYYFTKASVPRALGEHILQAKAEEWGLKGKCYPEVKSALKAAKESARKTDVIFIGGSTFVVGDALQSIRVGC